MEVVEVTATEAVEVAELRRRSMFIIVGRTASSADTRVQIVPEEQTAIKWKQPPLIKGRIHYKMEEIQSVRAAYRYN